MTRGLPYKCGRGAGDSRTMRQAGPIVHDSQPSAKPQDVAGSRSPGHTTIRDRSAKQPWLPVEKTTWDNWRFMLRARRVRVLGPEKAKLKLFYLALAGFTDSLLKGVDIGKFALPLVVMLHDLQIAEKTFYTLRRALRELGLLDWKQRRNRSTEYRVFTRCEWAAAVPCFDNPRSVTVTDRDQSLLPTYLDLCSSTENTRHAAAAVLPKAVLKSDTGQQQQQRKIERRNKERIEGLIAACAARARKLGRPYDEADERQRLAAGEIDVDHLQELADELQQEIDAQQYRRRRRNLS